MRKSFFPLVLIIVFFCLTSCIDEKKDSFNPAFVYLKGSDFIFEKESFFPIMMNYIVTFRVIDGNLVVSPTIEYDSLHQFDAFTKKEIHQRLHAHFQLLQELGFNSIRLIGLNTVEYKEATGELHFNVYNEGNLKETLPFKGHETEFLKELEEVIQIAKQSSLKLMILLPRPRKDSTHNEKRLAYISSILEYFSHEPQVFSYDFFNEPLYFDNSEYSENKDKIRSKKEAYQIVDSWKQLMNKHAPNQLFTIGYGEPIEVFEWDPSILPVDFLSFHTYHPLRVPNEIYWYSRYVGKPWILGETSLPADNDSISYLEQHQFLKEAMQRTVNCGGSGFGWWQFQDVSWGPFEHDFTPILNHEGITYTGDSLKVYGSLKHNVAQVFADQSFEPIEKCECMNNYYNIVGYKNFLIKGKVVNSVDGKPVEGAVIRGWNADWTIAANTFSKNDGTFTLYSNDEFMNFYISAPGMSTIKFWDKLDFGNYEMEELQDRKLEYHEIGFKHFLKYHDRLEDSSLYNEEKVIFNFIDSLFYQYKYSATMETKELEPLDFLD